MGAISSPSSSASTLVSAASRLARTWARRFLASSMPHRIASSRRRPPSSRRGRGPPARGSARRARSTRRPTRRTGSPTMDGCGLGPSGARWDGGPHGSSSPWVDRAGGGASSNVPVGRGSVAHGPPPTERGKVRQDASGGTSGTGSVGASASAGAMGATTLGAGRRRRRTSTITRPADEQHDARRAGAADRQRPSSDRLRAPPRGSPGPRPPRSSRPQVTGAPRRLRGAELCLGLRDAVETPLRERIARRREHA